METIGDGKMEGREAIEGVMDVRVGFISQQEAESCVVFHGDSKEYRRQVVEAFYAVFVGDLIVFGGG